jgi:cytochrome c oxidase cbb3-type subunit 3
MPAWGARIPRDQIWQLVAYVRSLSGEQPKSATPARSDGIEPTPFTIQNKVKGETR